MDAAESTETDLARTTRVLAAQDEVRELVMSSVKEMLSRIRLNKGAQTSYNKYASAERVIEEFVSVIKKTRAEMKSQDHNDAINMDRRSLVFYVTTHDVRDIKIVENEGRTEVEATMRVRFGGIGLCDADLSYRVGCVISWMTYSYDNCTISWSKNVRDSIFVTRTVAY